MMPFTTYATAVLPMNLKTVPLICSELRALWFMGATCAKIPGRSHLGRHRGMKRWLATMLRPIGTHFARHGPRVQDELAQGPISWPRIIKSINASQWGKSR